MIISALLSSGIALSDPGRYSYLETIRAISGPQPEMKPLRPITIAIVDDALNVDHGGIKPFLADGASAGYDVADGDDDVRAPADRLDSYGHGTFLVDAMIEVLTQTLGTSAHEYVNIVPIKSLSDYSTNLQLEAAFKGVEYATSIHADIVVTSWAVHTLTPPDKVALDGALNSDTLLITSAGNELIEKPVYPAAHAASLTVGGLDQNNHPWSGSNRGDFVDISAPAESVQGTDYMGTSIQIESGTSLSAALVAAAAALVKVYNPDFSPHEVRACLLDESSPIDFKRAYNRGKFGAGKLDVAAAIRCQSINSINGPGTDEPRKGGALPKTTTRTRGYLKTDGTQQEQRWDIKPIGEFTGIELRMAVAQSGPSPDAITLKLLNDTVDAEIITLAPGKLLRLNTVPSAIEFVPVIDTSQQSVTDSGAPDNLLISYRLLSEKTHTRWCSGTTIISDNATVTDGSNAENYAAHSSCQWLFAAPAGKLFEFEVTELHTEPTIDQLHFFNGNGTHEALIGVLSGTERPPVFRSWNDKTLLWFVSDGDNEAAGWSINARIVDPAE